MANLDFSGPFLKVERADQHIKQLEILLKQYVSDNCKRFRPQNQHRLLKAGRAVTFIPPPKHTPTVLGDLIHNLRVSLDHAYSVLVEANGNIPNDYSRFPFGKDKPSVQGFIDGHIKAKCGPSPAARDCILDTLEPYPGRQNNLWDIHRLDIADKHQCLLPTSVHAFFSEIDILDPSTGRVVAHVKDATMVDCGAISDGMAIFKNDLKDAFDVTFGKGQPLEGLRILPTVRSLRASTWDALRELEQLL